MLILLKAFPETSSKTSACKKERKDSRQKTQQACSPSGEQPVPFPCLLYTSDAADDWLVV